MACAPSEDSDQPGHSPSLIRVFTVRLIIRESYAIRTNPSWVSVTENHINSKYSEIGVIVSLRSDHLILMGQGKGRGAGGGGGG